MAREDNLLKGDDIHKLTVEEQSAGGRASVEARRRKRDLRLALEALLEKSYSDKKSGVTMTGAETISTALFKKALKGDTRAFEVIRSTVGQDPVQKIVMAEVDADVIDEVEKAVLGDNGEKSGD